MKKPTRKWRLAAGVGCVLAAAGVLIRHQMEHTEGNGMRMTAFEKYFVNSPGHADSVARHAEGLLEHIDIQPGWRYLDAGCGVGAAPRRVAETRPLDVTGVDIDPKQIETARAAGGPPNLRFEVADATRLPFSDGEFDIVATNKVTHHIPEWERALSEMARMVRPGGYLIYSDVVAPDWLARAGRRLLPAAGFPSEKALDAEAARAGLETIYRSRGFAQVEIIWRKGPAGASPIGVRISAAGSTLLNCGSEGPSSTAMTPRCGLISPKRTSGYRRAHPREGRYGQVTRVRHCGPLRSAPRTIVCRRWRRCGHAGSPDLKLPGPRVSFSLIRNYGDVF